jgi:hypothetical protein
MPGERPRAVWMPAHAASATLDHAR